MSTPEVDIDAMEYVLGLMDDDERRHFEAELLDNPELADVVWEWEATFLPLGEAVRSRRTAKRDFRAVEARIFADRRDAKRSRGMRRAVGFWQAIATLFWTATVASLTGVAILLAAPELVLGPRPALVAAVVYEDGAVRLARVRDDGRLVIEPLPAEDLQRSRELWLVPEGGTPRSLGLLDEAGRAEFKLPEDLKAQPGALLAVTLEPPGGSPTGRPTGPRIGSGALTEI